MHILVFPFQMNSSKFSEGYCQIKLMNTWNQSVSLERGK
uniref:Uncharacterized protein n=1 Tax=Anguilla anguilla TaxID=7936 RepID=A0A0E9VGK3_ANGAN